MKTRDQSLTAVKNRAGEKLIPADKVAITKIIVEYMVSHEMTINYLKTDEPFINEIIADLSK